MALASIDLTAIPLEGWIQIIVIAVGWIVTVVKIDGRLKSVEKDIKDVANLTRWKERFEERVLILRRDIDEMRHFRGFVNTDDSEAERRLRQDGGERK